MDDRDAPPVGAAFLLTQLGTAAAAAYAEAVAALDLTPPLTGILRLLRVRPGVSQKQLAGLLGSAPSRVVTWIDDLERRGLVARSLAPDDRRVNSLTLTAEGTRTLAQVTRVAREHEERVTAALTATERAQLTGLLSTLANAHGLPAGVHPGYRTA